MEFTLNENHDDCDTKYKEFDIVTRRYLEYCMYTGQVFEPYFSGMSQEDFENILNLNK